ncbi:MAG: adenine-specific methyltransferase EcoRI family protein [Lentisphaeria bacterium]|nr:adenine-specific methyltransferase EcoRI family protein [Lentisphaeria bacterium]
MAGNSNLQAANKAKKDEFYTQLTDIEKELRHYKNHFRDKTVFCNCDDPFESNFFKYFAMNFNFLGLKKLIATCYDGSPIAGDELPLFDDADDSEPKKTAHKIEIMEVSDENGDGAIDLADVELLIKNRKNTLTTLHGNGDFRSEECIELLKQADIVVTNPPFSLFREYMAQLVQYDKKFLIIGNVNSITYKEIFPLIKENRLWLGASIHSGDREFAVPDSYPLNAAGCRVDENGKKYIRVKGVRWFTNLDYPQRHEDLDLYKRYSPEEYPKYDNYDAVNVDKTSDIPYDYNGVMGVPITFLDKYNPEQFEIIGLDRYVEDNPHYGHRFTINGKETYARILIRQKGVTANEN